MKYIVHWPSQPVIACESHKNQLLKLAQVLGLHIVTEITTDDQVCINCKNEGKK